MSCSEERVEKIAEKESTVTLKVEDVMVKDVVKINEEATIREAAELMNKCEIGCLIAFKKGKVSGILTERDLLKKVVAEAKDASKIRVRDVMTSPLVVVDPNMGLAEAVRLMFQMKIKKLPVLEDKRLVGLVSLTDIARFQSQMMELVKLLAATQTVPKSMKKVVDRYIV